VRIGSVCEPRSPSCAGVSSRGAGNAVDDEPRSAAALAELAETQATGAAEAIWASSVAEWAVAGRVVSFAASADAASTVAESMVVVSVGTPVGEAGDGGRCALSTHGCAVEQTRCSLLAVPAVVAVAASAR